MKFILISLLLVVSAACSLLNPNPEDPKESYFTGKDLPAMSGEELKAKLTKKEKMGGGILVVEAYPVTLPLIELQAREQEASQAMSAEQAAQNLEQLKQTFIYNKTCFNISLNIQRFEKLSSLKEWKIEVFPGNAEENPVALSWLDPDHKPVTTTHPSYHGVANAWLNEGFVCSNEPVELGLKFHLKLKPSYSPWPFPQEATAAWTVDSIQYIDGKEVIIKQEKKKEGYRGW